ncbi:DgyrCDS11967 [Dimorphilus gyrociliatus]|uniref:Choline O-acetyltransferase n=1 Tax=Dimorphilus gyrociliatus TaxID=2664684 RepID=A0A7I8W512_9ANNE|nr:DgyrCDS11967 [Dimorphilus gyrociliatus]
MSRPQRSPHPVKKYVERVASLDIEEYPQWDLNKELPKLPVPDVDVTLDKYLRCIRPLVGDSQYENTKRLVGKFRETVANDLQSELLDYANQVENWAFDFWLEDMYFKNKLALPVNSNPGMVFPRQNFPEKSDALRFAARLISGILDYKLVIDSKQLPVDRARHSKKGQPLCMEQYYRLFSTYREPGIHKDSHVYMSTTGNIEPEHIIVACNNQLFPLYLKHNRSRLSVDNIYAQLKRIMTLADEGDANEEVGVLTSLQRDKWAECRLKLMEEPVNKRSLSLIENSIFILCIDHTLPATFNHQTTGKNRDDVSQALQMLHGLGSSFNSCNRWYDKTMQFVVCMDGTCGLNYEHSPAEGIAVVQLIEHLLKYMDELQKQKLCRLMSLTDLDEPQKLNWELKPEILDEIQLARNRIDKLIESLDLHILRFSDYGKEFVKSQNMSPDAFIQLALQLTYYKEYKKLVSTYESASIRRFRFGRVDNIRACSSEALDWVRAMVDEIQVSVRPE